jgi:hypothetical protein
MSPIRPDGENRVLVHPNETPPRWAAGLQIRLALDLCQLLVPPVCHTGLCVEGVEGRNCHGPATGQPTADGTDP